MGCLFVIIIAWGVVSHLGEGSYWSTGAYSRKHHNWIKKWDKFFLSKNNKIFTNRNDQKYTPSMVKKNCSQINKRASKKVIVLHHGPRVCLLK